MCSPDNIDEVLSLDWVSRLTMDELLSIFWVPLAARTRALEIQRAMTDIEARLQWTGTHEELVAELNVTWDELNRFLRDMGREKHDPLNTLQNVSGSPGDEVALRDAPPGTHGSEGRVDAGEIRARVADATAALPVREKYVVAVCHSRRLTLHEVGHAIGLADDAVSIFYAGAVLRLRSRLPEVVRVADAPK